MSIFLHSIHFSLRNVAPFTTILPDRPRGRFTLQGSRQGCKGYNGLNGNKAKEKHESDNQGYHRHSRLSRKTGMGQRRSKHTHHDTGHACLRMGYFWCLPQIVQEPIYGISLFPIRRTRVPAKELGTWGQGSSMGTDLIGSERGEWKRERPHNTGS